MSVRGTIDAAWSALEAERVAIDAAQSIVSRSNRWPSGGYPPVAIDASSTREVALMDDVDAVVPGHMVVSLWQGGPVTWTNMPSAHTLFLASIHSLRRVDLSGFEEARISCVHVAAAALGARLRLRYYTAYSANVADYIQLGASAEVDVGLGTGAGGQEVVGTWRTIAAGALGSVLLGVTGIDGDGAADPQFYSVTAEFR